MNALELAACEEQYWWNDSQYKHQHSGRVRIRSVFLSLHSPDTMKRLTQ